MKETERIGQLFIDLFNGDPWLDVNILHTLEGISAAQAAARIAPGRNSIWEIVNHMCSWRLNVLERVKGQAVPSPEHNYIIPVGEVTDAAWSRSIEKLKHSQVLWLEFLSSAGEESLACISPGSNNTYYYYIHGVLQHDAYHLGQIVLLAKLV